MSIESINDFRKNFYNIYHSMVVPALNSMEQERIKTRNKAFKMSVPIFLLIATILFFFMGMATSFENFSHGLLFIAIFAGVPAWAIYRSYEKLFESKIKKMIMPEIMSAFGNFKWQQTSPIRDGEIRLSKLFTKFECMTEDDNFVGSYKNVPIKISETELTYTSKDSEGQTETYTEFKGVLISIELPKKFTGHTIVKRSKQIFNEKGFSEVKLEDTEFSKQYHVTSTDQVEARYLLTPAFLQRFKNTQKVFGANRIACSFLNNVLLIAVPVDKDLFSLGRLNKNVTDMELFTTFLNELISIFEVVEELKLYEDTGL